MTLRTIRLIPALVAVYSGLAWGPLAIAQQSTAGPQLSASSTTLLRAVVRGSVTVSVRSVPVSLRLDPADPVRNYAAVPLSIKWNLNPTESQGFRVIGYFANPNAALVDTTGGVAVASSQVLGKIGVGEYRAFVETNEIGPAAGSLQLFERSVRSGSARGDQSSLLEIKVSDQIVQSVPRGLYQGMLYIEVLHY